ncbi:MAG: FecR domain-containing protein [Bacteroidales bacterium]
MNSSGEHRDEMTGLVVRYLAGEATPEEVTQLEAWVKSSEENQKEFLALRTVWRLGRIPDHFQPDEKAAWEKVSRKIHFTDSEKRTPVIQLNRRMAVAASIIALVALSVFLWFKLQPSAITISAGAEPMAFVLPDSSTVTLNRYSKLTYRKNYGNTQRALTLEGDGFFEVRPDQQHPFIVTAGKASVKVLGTAFYVDARKNTRKIEVLVEHGKVAFSSPAGELTLTRGEGAVFDQVAEKIVKTAGNPNSLAWKTGIFRFNDTPLAEVLAQINRAFGVTVTLSGHSGENCFLTATFDHPALDDLLSVIAATFDMEIKRDQERIILDGPACAP